MTLRLFIINFLFGFLTIPNSVISFIDDNLAEPGEFPFVVSLRENGKHKCSGAIISANSIITSKTYCTFDEIDKVTVVAGTISSRDVDKRHLYKITTSDNPEEKSWIPVTMQTLIRYSLDREISFDAGVQPIAYVSVNGIKHIEDMYVVGWGNLHAGTDQRVRYQYKVKTKLLDHNECQNIIPLTAIEECGHAVRGIGLCGGDYGAPLVYKNQLIGIAQKGDPCATDGISKFTMTYHLLDHIKGDL